jgi:hypothetical protein
MTFENRPGQNFHDEEKQLEPSELAKDVAELIKDAKRRVRTAHPELGQALLDILLAEDSHEAQEGACSLVFNFGEDPLKQSIKYNHGDSEFGIRVNSERDSSELQLEKFPPSSEGERIQEQIRLEVGKEPRKEDFSWGIIQHTVTHWSPKFSIESHTNSAEAVNLARQFIEENYPLPGQTQPEA